MTFPTNDANEDPSAHGLPSRVSELGSSHFFFPFFWLFGFLYIGSNRPHVSIQFINQITLLMYDHL